MLSAFVKDESGGVAIAYGMVVLTAAIVSLAGMVGSVLDHSLPIRLTPTPTRASMGATRIEWRHPTCSGCGR